MTRIPPNLSFEIDDAETEWSFRARFDLIHFQNLNGGIRDWPRLLSQIYEYVKNPSIVSFFSRKCLLG